MRDDHTRKVMSLLEQETDGELTTDQVAREIVNTIYGSWESLLKTPATPLKVGEAVKFPWSPSKTYHVAWEGLDGFDSPVLWLITSTSDYGALIDPMAPLWMYGKRSRAEAGKPGSNADGWKVGDKLSITNRRSVFQIIQVGDKSVLMRDLNTGHIQAEKNASLKTSYKKER